jgi:hypothetical protein
VQRRARDAVILMLAKNGKHFLGTAPTVLCALGAVHSWTRYVSHDACADGIGHDLEEQEHPNHYHASGSSVEQGLPGHR